MSVELSFCQSMFGNYEGNFCLSSQVHPNFEVLGSHSHINDSCGVLYVELGKTQHLKPQDYAGKGIENKAEPGAMSGVPEGKVGEICHKC